MKVPWSLGGGACASDAAPPESVTAARPIQSQGHRAGIVTRAIPQKRSTPVSTSPWKLPSEAPRWRLKKSPALYWINSSTLPR